MHKDFFTENRLRLKGALQGGIAVVAAYDKMQSKADMAAPYRQESTFWWLTGINFPGWILVLDGESGSEFLVRPALSRTEKLFESWLDDTAATEISGIATILSRVEYVARLKLQSAKTFFAPKAFTYADIGAQPNPATAHIRTELERFSVKDLEPVVLPLRAIKSSAEINAIQHSIDLTTKAFNKIYQSLSAQKNEAQISAELSYEFLCRGAKHAYDPIVAAGKNACTLHYTSTNLAPIKNGLVLIDVGAEYNGYAADITRTYAIGSLSHRERAVHQEVAHAHADIIAMIAPGVGLTDYLAQVDTRMKLALKNLGLLTNDNSEEAYRRYFPHAISHGLGVDVHDSLGGYKEFIPGMVLTVEPGIYVPEWSLGVRIEDDIAVTGDGQHNLSCALSTDF